jgi:tetratricopeptide (TPR) repeat protein
MASSNGELAIKSATVQIVDNLGSPRGCGLLIDRSLVVTCAHVVAEALGISPHQHDAPTDAVVIRFPYSKQAHCQKAKLGTWRSVAPPLAPERIEDIAVLTLIEKAPNDTNPAIMLVSDSWAGRSYMVCGFPESNNGGDWSTGIFNGAQISGWVQMSSTSETDLQIEKGFSGAGVWDEQLQGFAGIVVAHQTRGRQAKPSAYMIPTSVLQEAIPSLITNAPSLSPIDHRVSSGSGRFKIHLVNLPAVANTLIGREDELAELNAAWRSPEAAFLQIVAAAGTGKTALLDKWFRQQQADLLFYSFNSQGQSAAEATQRSNSDQFFRHALEFAGATVPPTAPFSIKAEVLADKLRNERVLLILDGVEALQDRNGALTDLALKELLQSLAARNRGMVICSTQIALIDIPDSGPRTRSLRLLDLTPAEGGHYLATLGVIGDDEELARTSTEFGNNPLALTLVGHYIADYLGKDVSRRNELLRLVDGESKHGDHATRAMRAYSSMLSGTDEWLLLTRLAYFNGPVDIADLRVLVPGIDQPPLTGALTRLHRLQLVHDVATSEPSSLAPSSSRLDCHALVRDHLERSLAESSPEDFRMTHALLFEHFLRKQQLKCPNKYEEMIPLFHAIFHGCRAGLHSRAFEDVYFARISHGDNYYLTNDLGKFGTDLSLLSHFFERSWHMPQSVLVQRQKDIVVSQANFALRGLGRLDHAIQQLKRLEIEGVPLRIWRDVVVRYSNLSQLLLLRGDVSSSIDAAAKGLSAPTSSDPINRMSHLVDVGDAYHQAGQFELAESHFREAERLQATIEPNRPILYSVPGYRYCDLLLTLGRNDEVRYRAALWQEWLGDRKPNLELGLVNLCIGRVGVRTTPEVQWRLDQAVDYLLAAGSIVHLAAAFLARSRESDLADLNGIACRNKFNLRLVDYLLAQAGVEIENGRCEEAIAHLAKAKSLMAESGYRRHDKDLKAMECRTAS